VRFYLQKVDLRVCAETTVGELPTKVLVAGYCMFVAIIGYDFAITLRA
jgi:hypothetical protein